MINFFKNFFSKNKNIVILLFLTMFFVLDRYLKYLSVNLSDDIILIKNFLSFSFYKNKYIAFSLPLGGWILNLVLLVLILFIFFYLAGLFKKKKWLEFHLWLTIFLGALSNIIDRIVFSYVVDYIDLSYFTVFNLADVLIVIPCFFIIFLNFKSSRKNTNK